MLPNLTWVPAVVILFPLVMPGPPRRMLAAAIAAGATLSIPAALDQLVLSCLAKDPAERPQSAKELSRRLAEVECSSTWSEECARQWWATNQSSLQQKQPGAAASAATLATGIDITETRAAPFEDQYASAASRGYSSPV
jgi:hypothetical protein